MKQQADCWGCKKLNIMNPINRKTKRMLTINLLSTFLAGRLILLGLLLVSIDVSRAEEPERDLASIQKSFKYFRTLPEFSLDYFIEIDDFEYKVEYLQADGKDVFRKFDKNVQGEYALTQILLFDGDLYQHFDGHDIEVTIDASKLTTASSFYSFNPVFVYPITSGVLEFGESRSGKIERYAERLENFKKLLNGGFPTKRLKVEFNKPGDIVPKSLTMSMGEDLQKIVFGEFVQVSDLSLQIPLSYEILVNGKAIVSCRVDQHSVRLREVQGEDLNKLFAIPKGTGSTIVDLDLDVTTQLK